MHPHSDARPSAFCTSHDACGSNNADTYEFQKHPHSDARRTPVRITRCCGSNSADTGSSSFFSFLFVSEV